MVTIVPAWLLLVLLPACRAEMDLSPPSSLASLGPWVQVQRFLVPRYVALGVNVSLECDYVVQQHATLYSLKWYKGSSQFYQYIPTMPQSHTVFSVGGLHQHQVVPGREGRRVVVLTVGMAASDVYRCELVAEGPPFHTTQRSANMTVVVVPKEAPVISGSREYYQQNEQVSLNCTAPLARPSVALTWFVNGRQVSPGNVRTVEHFTNPVGLERVTALLSLRVSHDHFRDGAMNITCVGQLADLYHRSAEVIIREPSSRWFASTNLYHTSGASETPTAGPLAVIPWTIVAILSLFLP
ncbi:uncharacterized protein [Panulirus ornatus]|uniref:uncharacterized protein n=1 Tax=Panulirus ornatus TaxID=150431 RepID=UPI003A88D52F